ncbi:MAG TPA: zinc dependent phospholipase C family protein [Acidobacteriaceae bacterium]|nr:zinc dependent phospholipase C family protein [Acidobacteriaceae bacterium]
MKAFRPGSRSAANSTRAQVSAVHLLIALLLVFSIPRHVEAYSFLTHQDIVDVAWEGSIRPALLARFPTITPSQLREARAYAYGGGTIQDMGYYPFGDEFFSDLTHYVRSGEFVNNLFQDAQTVDEYAFAIGALAHYVGDNDGHRYATNPATPLEFPPLGKKFGPIVTYDQAPHAHIRTEFAYDVEQLSNDEFAPISYRHSVRFLVAQRLLEQAFFDTYGLRLRSVLGRPRPAIASYRSSMQNLLPKAARAEVLIHRKNFPPAEDTPAFHQFATRQSQAGIDNGWAKYSRKDGFEVHFIAFLIRIVPKVGTISDLAIRGPNAETNRWYIESVNRTTDDYERMLRELAKDPRHRLDLPDRDLDTGNLEQPGSYPLTDKTYAELLTKLTARPNHAIPAGLQQNILSYYSNPDAPITTKKNRGAWNRVQTSLTKLRGMQTVGDKSVAMLHP